MKHRFNRSAAVVAGGLLAVVPLTACGAGETGDGDGPIELVMAVDTNPGNPMSDTLVYFEEEIEATLGDRVTVDAYYGGSIGDEVATLEALRTGEIDVVIVGSDLSALDPTFNIMELPFLFPDREAVTEFLDGPFGEEMSDSLRESAGLTVLAYSENGFRHLTNNVRPVVVPEDMSGLKIRVPEVPARIDAFEALGAVPTPMNFGEIYLALDQGALDGQENPLIVIDEFSFAEVQNYLSLTSHVYTPSTITMNAASFDGLPADVQEGLITAAEAAAERIREESAVAEDETIARFEADGMSVNRIDVQAFQAASAEIWPEIAATIPGDFADRVIEEYGSRS